jgi:virulence factor Mce-like protein
MSRLWARYASRLDWVPGSHRPRPLVTGVVALTVLGALLVVAFTQSIPFIGDGGRTVTATFADAGQLVEGRTPVRVNGIEVGTVDRVEPGSASESSEVTLRVDDDAGVVLARDASARIRYRTILGGSRFVELDPGSPSAPPLGDRPIPLERTGSQVTWDQFNEQFGPDTRQAQRRMLEGFREGLASTRRTGRTLEVLAPTLSTVGEWAEAVRGSEAGDLRRMVSASAATVEGLAREEGALRALVAGAERTLGATAGRREQLGELVQRAPAALSSTAAMSRRLLTTLDRLDPLVTELRPGARELAPAAHALRPALDQAEALLRESAPLLRDARPTLRNLGAMSRAGVPLIAELRPTLRRTEDEVLPILRERDPETRLRLYEAIGPTFAAAGGWGTTFDSGGHLLNFSASVAADSVVVPCGPSLEPGKLKRCDAVNDLLGRLFGGPPR